MTNVTDQRFFCFVYPTSSHRLPQLTQFWWPTHLMHVTDSTLSGHLIEKSQVILSSAIARLGRGARLNQSPDHCSCQISAIFPLRPCGRRTQGLRPFGICLPAAALAWPRGLKACDLESCCTSPLFSWVLYP